MQITVLAAASSIVDSVLNLIFVLNSENSNNETCEDGWNLSYLWTDCTGGLTSGWKIAAIVRLSLTVVLFVSSNSKIKLSQTRGLANFHDYHQFICFLAGCYLRSYSRCETTLEEDKYEDGNGSFVLVTTPVKLEIENFHKQSPTSP